MMITMMMTMMTMMISDDYSTVDNDDGNDGLRMIINLQFPTSDFV